MSVSGQGEPAEDAVQTEASDWWAKLRGTPSEEDLLAFQEWYNRDPRNEQEFNEIVETNGRLDTFGRTARAKEPDRLGKHVPGRITRTLLLIAAGLILALVVYAGVARAWLAGSSPGSSQQLDFASAPGQIRTVTLPDGSHVTLDTGSAFAVNFTPMQRRLRLIRGRARFDVAHDPGHPFIVTAGGSEVIAHGTIFDVDLSARQPLVSLLRGSVEVRKASALGVAKAPLGQFLKPGQMLQVASGPLAAEPVARPETSGDWTSGMLAFDDRPLREIVAGANRYAPSKIVLKDPDLGMLRYSISFPAKDSPGLAQALASAFNLAQSRDNQGQILLAHRK